MAQQYRVAVEAEIDGAEIAVVTKGLGTFNAAHTGGDMPDYLFITVRGDDGEIRGGLLGGTYLGWLQVQVLWLADTVRGQGYGTALMQAAEDEALRRGCPRVLVETLSFQALPFYEKRGYTIFSQLADFPPGGSRYTLTKYLAPIA